LFIIWLRKIWDIFCHHLGEWKNLFNRYYLLLAVGSRKSSWTRRAKYGIKRKGKGSWLLPLIYIHFGLLFKRKLMHSCEVIKSKRCMLYKKSFLRKFEFFSFLTSSHQIPLPFRFGKLVLYVRTKNSGWLKNNLIIVIRWVSGISRS
jgi:hypothetical protein